MKTTPQHDSRELPDDFASLCAGDFMQRNLITVHACDPIREVERVLADAKISGVPVLDDNDEIVGVLSMADLVNRYAEAPEIEDEGNRRELDDDEDDTEITAFQRFEPDELCAGDLMTPEITAVTPTASLREASRIMVQKQIHRLLVVDRGRVVGLLSTLDVLRAIAG